MRIKIIPLIILVLFSGITLGIEATRHGEIKKKEYNFWSSLVALIIQWALILWMIL
jgi:hypothetical protein